MNLVEYQYEVVKLQQNLFCKMLGRDIHDRMDKANVARVEFEMNLGDCHIHAILRGYMQAGVVVTYGSRSEETISSLYDLDFEVVEALYKEINAAGFKDF